MAGFNNNRIGLLVLGLLLAGGLLFVYGRVFNEGTPGDYEIRKGNYRLEDGHHDQAVEEFELALAKNPDHVGAHLGLALTRIQMAELDAALESLERTLALDPELGVAYANRGIVLDRLGRSEEALSDYERALELDPRLAKGPGRLWRFLHNVDEKPPTIRDRAEYLKTELAKPPEQRLLRQPSEDEKQRMYKID